MVYGEQRNDRYTTRKAIKGSVASDKIVVKNVPRAIARVSPP